MVRKVLDIDVPEICDLYNYYIMNTTINFYTEPISIEEMTKQINSVITDYEWLVYESYNKIVGFAYFNKWKERGAYKHSVETSVYVNNDYLKKGIGTKLYDEIIKSIQARDVHAIIAGISLPNEASVVFHEKFGFKKVAHFKEVGYKFDRWLDVGYWEKIIY